MHLSDGDLMLRPLRRSDRDVWSAVRRRNRDWLQPWEATLAAPDPAVPTTFTAMVRHLRREGRASRMLSVAVEYRGDLVGQVTVGGIAFGSLLAANIGYWIDRRVAGRGLIPRAVALMCDYAFSEVGLHRLEINARPENAPSLRVAEKLGFTRDGLRTEYMHIDGAWRDHVSYVLMASTHPGGVLAELRRAGIVEV